jgi:hypothetical protein
MALPIRRARGGRSGQVRAFEVTNFSGGLNLEAGQFNLGGNECAEIVDMDIVGRGGVRRRKAIRALNNNFNGPFEACPRSVWTYESPNGDRYVFVIAPKQVSGVNKLMWYSKNDASMVSFTSDFGLANNTAVGSLTAPARTAVLNDKVWGVWGYTGSVATRPKPFSIDSTGTLTVATNEAGCLADTPNNYGWTESYDFEAGSVAASVNARTIAAHYGYLWAAHTIEKDLGGTVTRFPSRVRWSHPGIPDRWRQDDYIDIEIGKDADEITALVPYRDHLLVFKSRSVHAIYGDNAENFVVVNLSNQFGAVSQEAVAATPFGVFFFDQNSGVWSWDGSSFSWRFEKLYPLVRDATIPADARGDVMMGLVENRIWVGVPWSGESTARARTLILDPTISTTGAWTMYSVGTGPFASVRRQDDSLLAVAGCSGTRFLQKLEQDGDYDEFTLTGTPSADQTAIVGSFRTSWMNPVTGADKLWKRPDIVLSSAGELAVTVEAHFNWKYDEGSARKSFYVSRGEPGGELYWGTDALVGTENEWDEASWGTDGQIVNVSRGSNIGRSTALSLRFTTPAGQVLPRWSLDGVVVKYRTKRVRG